MTEKTNDLPVSLFLAEELPPEKNALAELDNLLLITDTINKLKKVPDFLQNPESALLNVAVTPDFHKGAGIPIGTVLLSKGFVIPQAMGNDINCGMRFMKTDLTEEQIRSHLPELQNSIRHIFFEGGREIPMTPNQRKALFANGLEGILSSANEAESKGIWRLYDRDRQERELSAVQGRGSYSTNLSSGLEDFISQSGGLSYDAQIGSVGGGNHFVELQKITEIMDGETAAAWGLKKGMIVLMIHSGSLMIGHQSGALNRSLCQSIYPSHLSHPQNKIYLLPDSKKFHKEWADFWSSTYCSANFAFANRLFLALMVEKAVRETVTSCSFSLLYDSPHNFIWKKEIDGETCYLHRKGACSARGLEEMDGTPFAYYGEPVMIPGSMGSASYLLAGSGRRETLWSASHGAGRNLSRGEAIHQNTALFEEFIKKFTIITPIDPNRPDVKGRKEILKKWEENIRSEAPYAYKNIHQIIKAHETNQMARPVAEMEPVFTIKA